MPSCSVAGCRNRSGSPASVSEHRFPKDPVLRQKWAKFCGRGACFAPSKSAIVCSVHFPKDSFERDLRGELTGHRTNRKLKPGAVPTVREPLSTVTGHTGATTTSAVDFQLKRHLGVRRGGEMADVEPEVPAGSRSPFSPVGQLKNGPTSAVDSNGPEKVADKGDENMRKPDDAKRTPDGKDNDKAATAETAGRDRSLNGAAVAANVGQKRADSTTLGSDRNGSSDDHVSPAGVGVADGTSKSKSTSKTISAGTNVTSASPKANGTGEARSDEGSDEEDDGGEGRKRTSRAGSPRRGQNELGEPDAAAMPSEIPDPDGGAVEDDENGGVGAAAGNDGEPVGDEPMDTEDADVTAPAAAAATTNDGTKSKSASSSPPPSSSSSSMEIREKSPCSPAARLSNGGVVAEPEVSIEIVPVPVPLAAAAADKSAPSSAGPASNNSGSHAEDGEDDEDEDDEDDDEERALIVDEGDSPPEVVGKEKRESAASAAPTPAVVAPSPVKTEAVRKTASPTPDVKIVQIRAESASGGAGTKRPISPAVSVTKKWKPNSGVAQKAAVSINSHGGGGSSVVVNSVGSVSEAIASIEKSSSSSSSAHVGSFSSSAPPERLPDVKDMELLERMLVNVRRDIRGLDVQVKEKEREWNLLIHRKKKMEEYYLRLKRKREVETLETTGSLPPSASASATPTPSVAAASASPGAHSITVGGISAVVAGKPISSSASSSSSFPSSSLSSSSAVVVSTTENRVENTVNIISGMSGGKVKTLLATPAVTVASSQDGPVVVTPRAMTITPDMLYAGGGGGGKSKANSVGSTVASLVATSQGQQANNQLSSGKSTISTIRRWRPPHSSNANSGGISTSSTAASISATVTAQGKPAVTTQADVLQMYNEIVRQQQQQQQQQQQKQQQQQQQQQHHSYQQTEKLQQALTGGAVRAQQLQHQHQQQSGGFQLQPSQLQQALGIGSAEAAAAAAVVAAAAAAASRGRAVARLAGGAGHVQDNSSSTLASMLDASRGRTSDRPSSKAAKSTGVTVTMSNADKGKNLDSSKKAESHPTCHGCKKRTAQFVCAGCNSQWYCSRDCQISDWDEHCEECTA